jgi:predicted negative regulator of RcsB-dependent stress response
MEVYLTEEERVEALKRWWKENGKSVILGVALGLAVMGGWNAWRHGKQQKAETASAEFQQLARAVESKQADPALKLSERIVQQYQGSAYATYAALFQAKLKADAGDLAGAKKVLGDLLAASKDDAFRHVARLRLGQVLLALNENEEALKLLEPLKPRDMGEFEGRYEELKGDAYLRLNRRDDARVAYETAKSKGQATPLLDLKINDLAVETPKATP